MTIIVNELNNGLEEVWELARTLEHGCLNIVISEKLNELVRKELISSFEVKNGTIYIYCTVNTIVSR